MQAKRWIPAMLPVLVAVFSSFATKAYADWPTPLISISCLPAMNLLTLTVFSEWNLCTDNRDCTALENQGAYPAEVFLQRFSKVPFTCKMSPGKEVDIVVTIHEKDSLGLSQYELSVISDGQPIYNFKPNIDGDTYSLNLVVDKSVNHVLLMACLMKNQSILSLPGSVTCSRSGLGDGEVTLSNGG